MLELVNKADQTRFGPVDNHEKWIWIGGQRRQNGTLNDWFWLESGEPVSYTLNWEGGRQNDGATQSCLALYKRDMATKWMIKNNECSQNDRSFIYFCEK